MMIQCLNITILPNTFNVAINAKNNLIHDEKFLPRTIMPMLIEILVPTQEVATTSASAPP